MKESGVREGGVGWVRRDGEEEGGGGVEGEGYEGEFEYLMNA